MRPVGGTKHNLRASAQWGKKTKGEARASALWGKPGRGFAALLEQRLVEPGVLELRELGQRVMEQRVVGAGLVE
jgi:hypothetical protein